MALLDLTGQKFGRLTAIKIVQTGEKVNARSKWLCACSCGKEVVAIAYNLKDGHTKSCGCLRSETITKSDLLRSSVHGDGKTRLYRVWKAMKARCYNPNVKAYKNYGGRNIAICDEWNNSYENFKKWAIENGYDENIPSKECTIERIDVNKGYCPENCRWATMKEQGNNKRTNRLLTYCGKTQTSAMWAEEYGINPRTLHQRLKRGWSVEDAITRRVT